MPRSPRTAPDPQPARDSPLTRAGWAYGLVQAVSAVGLLVALFVLLPWPLALLIASGVTFTGAVAMEIMGARPPRQPAPDPTGGE
jgi:hypothetical protein